MELFIFNRDVELIGIVDEIEELEWIRRYDDGGSFTLKTTITENNIDLLKKGNLVCKKDDFEDVMYIDHRELADADDDGAELLIVEGVSLSTRILSSRITVERQIEKGTADKIMENILLKQTNDSDNPNRHISRLKVDTSIKPEFTETYEHNSLYKQLDEEFTSISQLDSCGFRIELDVEAKEYVFRAYKGKNIADRVLFSTAFDNLADQSFIESDTNYKNVGVIAGQGEEENRDLVVFNDDAYSDLDRIEMFIDARDIKQDTQIVQKPNEDGTMEDVEEPVKNGAEAVKLLSQRAKEKLEETSKVNSYSASIVGNTYEYRVDYELGDTVTVRNDKWAIFYEDTIREIREQYNSDGMNIEIEFGKELPSMATKIKQRIGRI